MEESINFSEMFFHWAIIAGGFLSWHIFEDDKGRVLAWLGVVMTCGAASLVLA
jgi:hypothetical protein